MARPLTLAERLRTVSEDLTAVAEGRLPVTAAVICAARLDRIADELDTTARYAYAAATQGTR